MSTAHDHAPHHLLPHGELCMALTMTVGRGKAARLAADLVGLGGADQLVDVGCGPGAAVREAARRGARATGVEPGASSLRLARLITPLTRVRNASFVKGAAEALPVPDASASVLWALSSVHHWSDVAQGLAEAFRVLRPDGRLLLAEPLVVPGSRTFAGHGATPERAGELVRSVAAAGFAGVSQATHSAGRKMFAVVTAHKPAEN